MIKMFAKIRDTTARKPSGWLGKWLYRDPQSHRNTFEIIINKLNLRSNDSYLDIATGGGLLLEMALQTVSKAAAIDHSADMVELATKRNQIAVDRGIVEIVKGDAGTLPWPDESFSCTACANAFFFIEHPQQVLNEISRVLRPKGRLVLNTLPSRLSLAGIVFKRPFDLRTYPDEQMREMFYTADFRVIEVNIVSGMQVWIAQKP